MFQVYPTLIPSKSVARYVPRCYGFKVHAAATLVRWQNVRRDDMRSRLKKAGVEVRLRDDSEDDDKDEDVVFEGAPA